MMTNSKREVHRSLFVGFDSANIRSIRNIENIAASYFIMAGRFSSIKGTFNTAEMSTLVFF